ncbi:ACT domain-containing protein ACR12 [Zea mays]|uniref:ACT domain-containing protein ACR n=1 Tax=Zea mays TaxID=4577 RepID=A0A1D6IT96_MAIZE|nr:ACT domain-containing protein ACR12 [Zea mays]
MALAASHHRLLPVAPTPAATRTPSRGHLRFRAARPLPRSRRICCQSINSTNVLGASSKMKALKDLGLDVSKGSVATDSAVTQTKFHIMRLWESSEKLAMGEFFGIKPPVKKASIISDAVLHCAIWVDIDIATHIVVEDDGPKRSMLYIETADRPGLLLEIIKIIADTNIDVESAEIDTEGLVAKDKFHVSYRGAKLNSSSSQVLINCLRYYLRRPETDEDSY